MNDALPAIYLVRHGETAWTVSGQHTGLTDIALTKRGESDARRLGKRVSGWPVTRIFTSPLQRAHRTCELAGFGDMAEVDPDLVEWDYGDYEGLTSVEIRAGRPGWQIFRHGCPGGESLEAIGARADRVIARLRALDCNIGLFSSGHIMRVLAARWLGLDVSGGRFLQLGTATLSILGYEHNRNEPGIRLWNDSHPGTD